MDEQDIDDLLNIPMTPTLYWDPKGKCLKVDKEAGKVSVRERKSLERESEEVG